MKTPKKTTAGDDESARIAKVIARAGICSRREAETLIAEGRVALNGTVLQTPAVVVKPGDVVTVDGQPLPERERTRLWMFHKPRGVVTTTHDPEGRPTVFDVLPPDLPRVMTIGRLDINTEGLLLLTNDGGLSRILELPATGWLRRYRVRAHGEIAQEQLDALRDGIAIDGILYGAVEATLDTRKGDNVWLTVGLREGKNREVKNILAHLGLDVNRLIRLSFGPFQLGELAEGAVEEVPRRVLKEQLGERLAVEAGADFRVREGDREPVQMRIEAADGEPRRRGRPADEAAPEEKGRVARAPRRPDAATTRRRHEADVDHNAETRAAPNRSRGRLGAKAGAEAADRAASTRRTARPEPAETPRAHRSGKSFEVDRRGRAPVDEPPRPGRTGARVKPAALDDPNARITRPPKPPKPPKGGETRRPQPVETGRRSAAGKRAAQDAESGYRPPLDARAPRPDELPKRERPARRARDDMPTGIVYRPAAERSGAEPGRRQDRPDRPDRQDRQDRPGRAGAPGKGEFRSKGMLGPKPDGAGSKARGTRSHTVKDPSSEPGRRPRPTGLDTAPRGAGRPRPERDGSEREDRSPRPPRPARAERPRTAAADRAGRESRGEGGSSPAAKGERPARGPRTPRSGGPAAGGAGGRGPKGPGKPRGPNADRRR